MASSASAPSSPLLHPLSPTVAAPEDDNDDDTATSKRKRLRKRKVDSNSSPSSPLQPSLAPATERIFRRKIKSQRNRILMKQENRISNFSGDHNSSATSSEDEESELRRQRQRRSLSRLRKANRIIPGTFPAIAPTFTSRAPKSTFSENSAQFPNCLENDGEEELVVSVSESDSSQIHLEWKGHGGQVMDEIRGYFEQGELVDVTLICDGSGAGERLGAHKIILASYSDYFRKILEDTPTKHPVMSLKGFSSWEVQTLLNFMYSGEVSVGSNQVDALLRAAASLQIRGVAECLKGMSSGSGDAGEARSPSSRSCHNNDDVKMGGRGSPGLLNLSISGRCQGGTSLTNEAGSNGPQTARAHHPGFPIHQHHHPSITQQQPNSASSPPFPRRKQARPRRRSGDFVAQDLRLTPPAPPDYATIFGEGPPFRGFNLGGSNNGHRDEDDEETVLDFTISHHHRAQGQESIGIEKVLEGVEMGMRNQFIKNWHFPPLRLTPTQLPHRQSSPIKTEFEVISPLEPERASPPEDLGRGQGNRKRSKRRDDTISNFNGTAAGFFKGSPPSPSFLLNFNPSGNGFLQQLPHHNSDSESNNPETPSSPPAVSSPAAPPHSTGGAKKQRNGDPQGGGTQGQWPSLPLGPAPIFGRHRAQHSAPRGGPPRAWSNADLTEALHNVWQKRMTTSQASRTFGIPYNSLLMYVRGKYGKSLHLDVLKKGVDMAMESNAVAVAKTGNAKSKGQQPLTGRGSTSPNSSPSSNTPPHNNNNTITSKGSKGKAGGGGSSPTGGSQQSLNLSSLLGQGLSGGSPDPIRLTRHQSPEVNPSLGELMPPGFPFMGGIFGDYPPPFPFPTVAAANAALSHILPPHHPHHLLTNSHRRVNHHHNGPSEK